MSSNHSWIWNPGYSHSLDSFLENKKLMQEVQQELNLTSKRNKKYLQDRRLSLLRWRGGKCIDCGCDDPRVLDFDHRDPKQKDFTIGARRGANFRELLEEAQKCDVRCANCHRIRTHTQRNGITSER